jgi:TRAP-type C4-dicarboxylate transport system permease small subunit
MKILNLLVRVGEYGAILSLFVLMMLVVANIVGRYFFHHPVMGTVEIGSYLLLMIVGLGLGGAALERRHIKVDLLMDRLPKKTQLIIDIVMLIGSVIMLGVMTWASGDSAMGPTRYSAAMRIPDTPFKWVFTVGWAMCCMGALALLIQNFQQRRKHGS